MCWSCRKCFWAAVAAATSFSSAFDMFSPEVSPESDGDKERRCKRVPITQPRRGREEHIIAALDLRFIAYWQLTVRFGNVVKWWWQDVELYSIQRSGILCIYADYLRGDQVKPTQMDLFYHSCLVRWSIVMPREPGKILCSDSVNVPWVPRNFQWMMMWQLSIRYFGCLVIRNKSYHITYIKIND